MPFSRMCARTRPSANAIGSRAATTGFCARAASVDRLEDHLDAFLDYGEITTSIVLSSAVEQRPIQEPGSPQDSG